MNNNESDENGWQSKQGQFNNQPQPWNHQLCPVDLQWAGDKKRHWLFDRGQSQLLLKLRICHSCNMPAITLTSAASKNNTNYYIVEI